MTRWVTGMADGAFPTNGRLPGAGVLARLWPLAAMLLCWPVTGARADEAPPLLSSFGYVRAGGGVNRDGGPHACYQLPGARSKYRLGNECDAYGEVGLRVQAAAPDGPRLRGDLRYAYFGSDDAPTSGDFSLAEAWVGVAGLLPGSQEQAQIWIGRRFYKRNDIHLIDLFYWFGTGDGLGVEEVDLGVGRLAYAYFRDKPQPVTRPSATTRRRIDRHDLQLSAIPVNAGGTLTIGGDWRRYRTGGASTPADDSSGTGGWHLAVQHKQSLGANSDNVAAIQYGRGVAKTLGAGSDLSAATGDHSFRLLDHVVWRLDETWVAQAVGLIEWRHDGAGDTVWGSLGARPVYAFTDDLAVAIEVGVDIVDPPQGQTRALSKITLAPMLTAGRDYYDRPQFRLYATYARWNDPARLAGLTSPGGDRDGLSFGLQVETWW